MKWLLPVLVVAATTPAVLAWPRPAAEARVVRECEEALRTGSDEEQLKALDRLKALGARGKAAIPVLIQYLPDAQPRNQARAADVLAVYGPAARDALPVLTDLLRQRPWPFLIDACLTTFPALGDPGNAELIRVTLAASSDGRRRVNSLQPLLDQYPDAVAPVLIEHLTDSTQRVRVRAVQLLGRAAVPRGGRPAPLAAATAATRTRIVGALWSVVAGPDSVGHEWAVAGLLDLDPAALPRLMPTVIALFRDNSGQQAGAALLRRGPAGARALLDYLHEPDENASPHLVQLLADFPPSARPVLVAGLSHPDPIVRERVLTALMWNGGAVPAWDHLCGCLADESPSVRLRAAQVMAHHAPARSVPALPVLVEAAFGPDRHRRRAALVTLGDLEKYARPAVPALLRRTQTGDLETRFAAATALTKIAPETWRTSVPVAIEALRTPPAFFGEGRPVAVLRDIGPNARAALHLLREAMAGDPETVAVLAAEAVARVDPEHNADALDRLIGYLRWTDDEGAQFPYRDPATDAIRRLGPIAKVCLPALLEILPGCRRPRDAVRIATAVLAVDPTATPALDRFRAALKRDATDGIFFLSALDDLDPAAAKVLLPDLIAALSNADRDVRGMAVLTLRNLGPAAASALPALRELAKKDADREDVQKAIRAIEGKK